MPATPNQSVTPLLRDDVNFLDLLSNSDLHPTEAANKLNKNPVKVL